MARHDVPPASEGPVFDDCGLPGEFAPGVCALNETAAWAGQPSAENFPLPVAPCYQAPAFRGIFIHSGGAGEGGRSSALCFFSFLP